MIIRALTIAFAVTASCSISFAQGINDPSKMISNYPVPADAHLPVKLPPDLVDEARGPHGFGHPPNHLNEPFSNGAMATLNPLRGVFEHSGVELSDDQIEQMTAIRSDFTKVIATAGNQIMTGAGDLKEVLSAKSIDREQAKKIFSDIKASIDACWNQFVDSTISVANVFSPDQRQKLKIAFDRWQLGAMGHTVSPPQSHNMPAGNELR
jgi:hypothetical protein